MTENEFRQYAESHQYDQPEAKSQPANKFFDSHVHERDLIVLITQGTFTVGYGDREETFGAGEMCHVEAGVDHTDAIGPEGASYVLAWR